MVKATLKEIIDTIKTGAWCSIRFIKADLDKGKGGEIVEIPKCRIARLRSDEPAAAVERKSSSDFKPANHNQNFTINIQLPNKQIRKIHPVLITHLNDLQAI